MLYSLIFILSMTSLSHADESENEVVDYITLKKGEHAPFDGKLLKNNALAKIISNNNERVEKLKVEHNYALSKIEIDLGLKYDLLESQRSAEEKMYKKMINARDEQIKLSAKKDTLQKLATYGGFILGAATSIAIFYSVD